MLKKQRHINFYRSPKKGFSLLDASILLIIFALVAISFLAINSFENTYKQTKIDHKRIQNIKSKIEAIKLKNSAGCVGVKDCRYTVLPCPAKEGNGIAMAREVSDNTCSGISTKQIGSESYYYGEIPYVTLGIAKEDALNRYGNYYAYIIPVLGAKNFAPDGYANYKIFDTGDKQIDSNFDFAATNQFSDLSTSSETSSELCTINENKFYEGELHTNSGIYRTTPSSDSLFLGYTCQDDLQTKYVASLTNQDSTKYLETTIN